MKKIKRRETAKQRPKKLCRKCRDRRSCHYCGRTETYFYNSFLLRDNGPTHYICRSCAD